MPIHPQFKVFKDDAKIFVIASYLPAAFLDPNIRKIIRFARMKEGIELSSL